MREKKEHSGDQTGKNIQGRKPEERGRANTKSANIPTEMGNLPKKHESEQHKRFTKKESEESYLPTITSLVNGTSHWTISNGSNEWGNFRRIARKRNTKEKKKD